MLPFRKILFPVDYSEPCLAILPYVKETLRHFGATLSLVHSYGPEALAFSDLPITDPGLASDARAEEEKRLKAFAEKEFAGTNVDTFVELGEAGSAIHRVVQHQGADLVMLATHGRGPVRRLLLGSVAAKVLHDISPAVWTGTGSAIADHVPSPAYKKILCAIDTGEESAGILKAAHALAVSYGAELCAINTVEMPMVSIEAGFTTFEPELMEAAEESLKNLKTKLGIDCAHSVIRGFVPEAVCDEAARIKADLIVVGRGHMQGAVSRMWSHLYGIVRRSPCPVLSI
jgi:nucleotide-binding universal stress UspA family protein